MTLEEKISIVKQAKEIMKTCEHELVTKEYNAARCVICPEFLGAYCEKSPTLICNYWQEDGRYDEDNCIYCGEPEERK